jgi:hypothetical protein
VQYHFYSWNLTSRSNNPPLNATIRNKKTGRIDRQGVGLGQWSYYIPYNFVLGACSMHALSSLLSFRSLRQEIEVDISFTILVYRLISKRRHTAENKRGDSALKVDRLDKEGTRSLHTRIKLRCKSEIV